MLNRKLWTFLAAGWLIVVSAVTANRVAPASLNADILLNTVMALQNVTPFYWGQNRLLNVLPLLISLIRNPNANLTAVLLFNSGVFFALIYAFARTSVRLIGQRNELLTLCVFVLTSSGISIALTIQGLANVTIGHIEYSLPALILLACFGFLFGLLREQSIWVKLIVAGPLVFIAIGLNPTIVIPTLFIVSIVVAYRRRADSSSVILAALSIAAYGLWREAVRRISPTPYEQFSLAQIPAGVESAVVEIVGVVDLVVFLPLLSFVLLIGATQVVLRKQAIHVRWSIVLLLVTAAGAFSLMWIIAISGNQWISINGFGARYFTFALFGFFFISTTVIAALVAAMQPRVAILSTAVVGVTLVVAQIQPIRPFNDYEVFRSVDTLTQPGSTLYAGDYWYVWPSVLRDMRNGYQAFGFGFRAQGNQAGISAFVSDVIKTNGFATVYCLKETTSECISQVKTLMGPVKSTRVIQESSDVTRIDITTTSAVPSAEGG